MSFAAVPLFGVVDGPPVGWRADAYAAWLLLSSCERVEALDDGGQRETELDFSGVRAMAELARERADLREQRGQRGRCGTLLGSPE